MATSNGHQCRLFTRAPDPSLRYSQLAEFSRQYRLSKRPCRVRYRAYEQLSMLCIRQPCQLQWLGRRREEKPLSLTGGCLCGAVTYSVSGKLRDARSCHCSRCRKAFSSQASAYALVDPSEIEWKSGEDLLTSYTGEHGAGLMFCCICGSTLCGVVDGQVHGVTLGCVNGDPDIEVARHIFVASKAAWEVLPQGIVTFEEAPPD